MKFPNPIPRSPAGSGQALAAALAVICSVIPTADASTVLIDYTFDGNAGNDVGAAVQKVDNAVAVGSANTGTGLITTGTGSGGSVNGHAIGFNSSGLVNLSAYTGFIATFQIDSITLSSGTVDGLLANGMFFGVVAGTGATGQTGTSLFTNDPKAFGYIPGSTTWGDHQTAVNSATVALSTSDVTPTGLTTTVPTNASLIDGFTVNLTVLDDNTWTLTSSGLSTELNGSGTLSGISYSDFAAGTGLNVSLQGRSASKLDMARMTLTAIPEPSGLLLGAGALFPLMLRRRRSA